MLPPAINMAEETNGPQDEETNPPTEKISPVLLICDTILYLARTEVAAWRLVLLALIGMLKYTFGASIPSSMVMPIAAYYAPAWIYSPLTKPGLAQWSQAEESCNDTTQTTPLHMEQPTASSLPLAPIITAILLAMTGAGLMAAVYRYYSGRSSHPNQPTDADQVNNNVEAADVEAADVEAADGEAADVAPADEDPAALMAVNIQLQNAGELVAGLQGQVAMMMGMQLDTILRKPPHTRTPREQVAIDAWARQRAQL